MRRNYTFLQYEFPVYWNFDSRQTARVKKIQTSESTERNNFSKKRPRFDQSSICQDTPEDKKRRKKKWKWEIISRVPLISRSGTKQERKTFGFRLAFQCVVPILFPYGHLACSSMATSHPPIQKTDKKTKGSVRWRRKKRRRRRRDKVEVGAGWKSREARKEDIATIPGA